jgi:general secretion pathway protein A
MYERFFGFRERPFELTPDPRFLFLSPTHREAATNLEYGISARKCLTVLVGEVGSGKTTLARRTLARAETQGTRCIFLKNPVVTPDEFYAMLGVHVGLAAEPQRTRAVTVELLERTLAERSARGMHSVLIVDEAQSLSDQLFEELRLLTNMETDTLKLLPILLIGQPELGTRLNDPVLRHLKQRVALRCVLEPLDLQGTATYMATRIMVAGGRAADVFSREAVEVVHQAAHGLPRAISVLCDNALITAFALNQRPVTAQMVRDVCKDFDYRAVPAVQAEPPAAPAPAVDDAPLAASGDLALTPVEAEALDRSAGADIPNERVAMWPRRLSIFGMGRR